MNFTNRDVIVTGGTGGLGTAVVAALLDAGARCIVPHSRRGSADTWPLRDRVTLVPDCDLTREADVTQLYDAAPQLWASIHLAGGFDMAPIDDTDRTALQRMLDVNLITCFLCCRHAVLRFGDAGGRIVNVAARPALEPRQGAGMTAYVASKAAVAALTQALGAELASRKVLVNAVAPSIIDTAATRSAMPDASHAAWPTPAEIARTIVFLASPDNLVTSSAVVPVYGRA